MPRTAPAGRTTPRIGRNITRAVEDRLSDALHERLTQRFIDRRTSQLMRHLRDEEHLALGLDDSGAVSLGGEHVGKLEGFRFAPDPRAEGIHGRTLRAAALKGLEGEIERRARGLATAGDKDDHACPNTRSSGGRARWWRGLRLVRIRLEPRSNCRRRYPEGLLRELVQARLEAWVAARIGRLLGPLVDLRDATERRDTALPGEARGIAFQLAESLGTLDAKAPSLPPDLSAAARALKRLGVRVGMRSIYLPKLLKPEASSLAALLWAVHARMQKIPPPPTPGLTSFPFDGDVPPGFMAAAGFRVVGPRAVRLDMLERIDGLLEQAARIGRAVDETMPELASLLGCSNEEVMTSARALGYLTLNHKIAAEDGTTTMRATWRLAKPPRRVDKQPKPAKVTVDADSPFARLAALVK